MLQSFFSGALTWLSGRPQAEVGAAPAAGAAPPFLGRFLAPATAALPSERPESLLARLASPPTYPMTHQP